MEVKGIIFDWAGTVVDYGCMAPTKVFIDVLKDRGINITMAEARGPMGLAKKDHVKAGAWTIGLTTCGNEVGLSPVEIDTIDPAELQEKIRRATQKLEAAGAHYVVECVADCRHVIADINKRILNGEKP